MPEIRHIKETDQYGITLNPGEKCSVCTCGHSKTLPICDSTHNKINEEQGTSYRSVKIINPSEVKLEIVVSSGNWKTAPQ